MSSLASGPAPAWRPSHNPWLVALVVTIACFMEVLDTTIVNVSLPHIAGTLSAGTDESTWTLTSYLVANGIVLPLSGWFAAVLGRKRYFLLCIATFTAASLCCGLATTLPQLVVFRLVQGFFGGGLQPTQQAIVLDTFEPRQRATAFSLTAVAIIVAPVLGPTFGGWITDHVSWRWIFFINIPVGIVAWAASLALVEDPPHARRTTVPGRLRIDYIGLGLVALGLGALQVTLDRGEQKDWFSSTFICVSSALAAGGMVGAVTWLLRQAHPLVDLRLFAHRAFAVGCFQMFVCVGLLYSAAVLMPQIVQADFGYTSTLAGLMLSPGGLVIIMFIPLVNLAMRTVQTRLLVMAGFLLVAASSLYTGTLSPDADFRTFVLMRCTQTIGLAFLFVPMSSLTFSELRPDQVTSGSALFSMARNIGGSVGIALMTSRYVDRTQARMHELVQNLSPLNPVFASGLAHGVAQGVSRGLSSAQAAGAAQLVYYRQLLRQATVLAFDDAFRAAGLVAFLAAFLVFMLPATRLTGRAPTGGH